MAFDAVLEQLRRAHLDATASLEARVRQQELELASLRGQLAQAQAETERYKDKYGDTLSKLQRYSEKYEQWVENIRRAKQEKKRDAAAGTAEMETEYSTDVLASITPPSAPPRADAKAQLRDSTTSTQSSNGERPAKKRGAPARRSPTALQGELAAEFPAETPAARMPTFAAPAPVVPAPAAAPAAAAAAAAAGASGASTPGYKYVEVVRKKKERELLPATDCDLCKQFIDAVTSDSTLLDRKTLVNLCSRHRTRFERPPTPPGFWDLSFPTNVPSAELTDT